MGGHRPGRDQERRLTLLEAAEVLGISKDGVRMRVRRGQLPSVKGEDGRVYVFVDNDQDDVPPESSSEATHPSRELVEVLRAQVEDLQSRLDRESEANRENRRIIAALLERVPPALEAPVDEQGSPATAETVEEASERTEPRSTTPRAQEGTRTPWYSSVLSSTRRLLGRGG